jgi:cysteine desulfurase
MAIYLDNAATTALDPQVLEVLLAVSKDYFANPSSLHSLGFKSQALLKSCRKNFAESINVQPGEIIFTSGATESNNAVFEMLDYDLIITSPSEHASVIEPAKASAKPILWLSLDKEGFIDLDELHSLLKQNRSQKVLLSIMHGNNEIGTIQNLEAISELIKNFDNVIFHSDCVQTFSKHHLDFKKLKIDLASFCAHKLHGPKGVGALFISKNIQENNHLKKSAYMLGGSQELGLRSGTENLAGICGFLKAIELASTINHSKNIYELSLGFYNQLKANYRLALNGPQDFSKRVIGNLNISFLDSKLKSEELLLQLDLAGICASSGSACTSNKSTASSEILSSYVLRACQVEPMIADRAIRLSLSRFNTTQEMQVALEIITKLVKIKETTQG